jgi:hypothetical protein
VSLDEGNENSELDACAEVNNDLEESADVDVDANNEGEDNLEEGGNEDTRDGD